MMEQELVKQEQSNTDVKEEAKAIEGADAKPDVDTSPSTVQGHVLMPMRDMAGYSFFVAWAFLFGWGRSLAENETDLVFFVSRAFLFGGIALGAIILFITRGDLLRAFKESWVEVIYPTVCMLPGITFFVAVPEPLAYALWALAGVGQSIMFFIWGVRLRILSSKQQLYVICTGFVCGGAALAIMPFMLPELALGLSILFPWASYVSLVFARIRFKGNSDRLTIWDGEKRFLNGIREFRNSIPFKSDRRVVILKGIFSCVYSVFLGFVTCMVLCQQMVPSNEVAIGIGNVASAFFILLMLYDGAKNKDSFIARLFLPATCISMCMLGATWPGEWSLVSAFLLFAVFGCLEIMNAYSAYVGTSYDAVRWFWELHASKMGNSVGFFLGWLIVVTLGPVITASGHVFLLSCFILCCAAVVAESLLFGHSIFGVSADADEDGLEGAEKLDSDAGEGLAAAVDEYYIQITTDMAAEYKLSPRQTEIFLYLARGRNVQFIREKLVVSTPTVKSHVYSIYQKMGIHSHQELIDMVEQRLKGN